MARLAKALVAPTTPLADIASIVTTRIGSLAGKDTSAFTVTPDRYVTAYQLRDVPGSTSPQTAGVLIESGGPLAAGVAYAADVTRAELAAAGDASEGDKIIKVFVQGQSGLWSA